MLGVQQIRFHNQAYYDNEPNWGVKMTGWDSYCYPTAGFLWLSPKRIIKNHFLCHRKHILRGKETIGF